MIQNPEEKSPLGKHGCRWENIEMYLKGTALEGV
jgi:hypothetical protein